MKKIIPVFALFILVLPNLSSAQVLRMDVIEAQRAEEEKLKEAENSANEGCDFPGCLNYDGNPKGPTLEELATDKEVANQFVKDSVEATYNTPPSKDSQSPESNVKSVAPGGFVPCEGAGCSACHLVTLVERILSWLIGVMLVIFSMITAYAGFSLVTSGGNPEAKSDAKKKLMNAFIGLVIVMCAWLLVDTLMRALLSGTGGSIKGIGPWSEIECKGQTPTSAGM